MGFDSHPQDSPHDVMTLIQMPVEMAGGGEVVDPQASLETVGDHDVTVIRRGDACTSFVWEQDGLQLTLTNAYDPPGEIRYTCDEMRQVIASIR
jgi:hypothetical protein